MGGVGDELPHWLIGNCLLEVNTVSSVEIFAAGQLEAK